VGGALSSSSCQSQLVLSWCIKAFIKLHNESSSSMSWSDTGISSMSWSNGGIDAVLKWILTDVDDSLIQQVCLFYTRSIHTHYNQLTILWVKT